MFQMTFVSPEYGITSGVFSPVCGVTSGFSNSFVVLINRSLVLSRLGWTTVVSLGV